MGNINKILFLIHTPPPYHGAAIVGEFIMKSSFINKDLDIDYFSIGSSKSLKSDIFSKLINQSKIYRFILNIIIKNHYNNFYYTMNASGFAFYRDLSIILPLIWRKKKVIIHLHNKGISNRKRWFDVCLYRYVLPKVKIILLSKRLFYDVSRYVGSENVLICPNGVNSPKNLNNLNLAKEYDFLFLSNFLEQKGIIIFIEAIKLLQQSGYHFKCAIVGKEKDVSKDYLEGLIASYNLKNIVTVFPNGLYDKEKELVFRKSKVFIFPTFYSKECFPLVLLEAMSFSLPIISTNEGAIEDLVTDLNGQVIKKKSSTSLADAMKEYLLNPDMIIKHGKNSEIRFNEEYTMQKFEKRFKNIIKNEIS